MSYASIYVNPMESIGKETRAMPLFAYRCERCGHVAEFLERAAVSRQHECPECRSHRMKRQAAAFGVGKGESAASNACPTGTCPLS
jgi:putative FmdB family regulatory protein